jgi:hypothetical protein
LMFSFVHSRRTIFFFVAFFAFLATLSSLFGQATFYHTSNA